jgi:hypothetical protein
MTYLHIIDYFRRKMKTKLSLLMTIALKCMKASYIIINIIVFTNNLSVTSLLSGF